MTTFAQITFENIQHAWLWIVLTALGAGWLYWMYRGIFERTERKLTWLLMLLRGAGLLALWLALAKPTWTRDLVETNPGHVAVIVDNSVSMSLPDPSGKSRYALAAAVASDLQSAFERDRSGSSVTVDLFGVDGTRFSTGLPEQPLARATDLARALSETTTQLKSQLLLGSVLISDGMANTGPKEAAPLGEARAPVFTVGFQADAAAGNLDLAVRAVQSPEKVLVKNEVKVDGYAKWFPALTIRKVEVEPASTKPKPAAKSGDDW